MHLNIYTGCGYSLNVTKLNIFSAQSMQTYSYDKQSLLNDSEYVFPCHFLRVTLLGYGELAKNIDSRNEYEML